MTLQKLHGITKVEKKNIFFPCISNRNPVICITRSSVNLWLLIIVSKWFYRSFRNNNVWDGSTWHFICIQSALNDMKSNIPTKHTHTHWQQLHQKLMNHAYFFSMLLLLLFIPLFRSHNIEIEFFFNVLYAKRNYLQKKFQYPYFVVAFYSEFVDKPIDIKWAINSVGMIINNTNE